MMPDGARARAWLVTALGLTVVLAYAACLVGGVTFVGRDHLTHTLPGKTFLAQALADGMFPQWWNGVDLGVAFAANPNHSALYPPAWLLALLPMPWAADALLIGHVFVAGVGSALLARRLGADHRGAFVGGTAFMLSGFVTSTVVHGGPLLTLAWTPWVAVAALQVARSEHVDARRVLVLAGAIAAQLLAGDPSIAVITALVAFAMAVAGARRRGRAAALVAVAYAGGAVMAAVVLLPAVLFAAHSERGAGIASDVATAWSMHPLRVLETLWPGLLGDPNDTTRFLARAVADSSRTLGLSPGWALSLYVSVPIVALAAIGWRATREHRMPLAIAAVALLVLALGDYTPVYGAYRAVFPPEWFLRYPEKYFLGTLCIGCALAGVGWTTLVRDGVTPRRLLVALLALTAVAVVFGIGILPALDGVSSDLAPAVDVDAAARFKLREGAYALLVVAGLGATLYLAPRHRSAAILSIALVTVHLVGHTWQLLPTMDRAIVTRRPQILGEVAANQLVWHPTKHLTRPGDPLPAQARTLYEGAVPNTATMFGLRYLVGYDQGHSAVFAQWMKSLLVDRDRALDRFGVDLEIVEAGDVGDRTAIASDAPYGPYMLVANTGQRPRAFVTTSWRWYPDAAAVVSSLATQHDLSTVALTGTGDNHVEPGAAVTPCTIRSDDGSSVSIECDGPAGYLVLLDAWAPGWSAYVDGAATSIARADAVMRAVPLSSGRHTVVFRYETPGLRLGAALSALGWLAWGALFLVARRRHSRTP